LNDSDLEANAQHTSTRAPVNNNHPSSWLILFDGEGVKIRRHIRPNPPSSVIIIKSREEYPAAKKQNQEKRKRGKE